MSWANSTGPRAGTWVPLGSTTIPLSLSFKSMSQREFNQRVKQAEDWVKTDLWPHIGDDLKRMIEEYLEESA